MIGIFQVNDHGVFIRHAAGYTVVTALSGLSSNKYKYNNHTEASESVKLTLRGIARRARISHIA